MDNINKDQVIKNITNDIINEIKNSKVKFTEEEVNNRINSKINDFFNNKRRIEDENKKKQLLNEEKFIEEEFKKNCDEENNDEENNKTNENNENNDNELSDDVLEGDDTEEQNNEHSTIKNSFFLEISKLYKEEYRKSLNGFNNFVSSFRFMKYASVFEKLLILLFIVVPALLSGFIGFALLLIILLIWQINIIIKILLKFFNYCEEYLLQKIKNIKNKINSIKNSGGFFKKLIFCNFLYSILFINGIFYIFIKGSIIPLSSLDKINKILGNLISKGTRAIGDVLNFPSALLLSNIKNNALIGNTMNNVNSNSISSKRGNTNSIISKSRIFDGYSHNIFFRRKTKKQKNKQTEKNNKLKEKNIFDNKELKTVNNNLKEKDKSDINTKNTAVVQNYIRNGIEDLVFNPDKQKAPTSYNLSDKAAESLLMFNIGKTIFGNVKGTIGNMIESSIENNLKDNKTILKINDDLENETNEKINSIRAAESNLSSLGYDNPISLSSQYKELRDNGVEYPTKEILRSQNDDWDNLRQDDKIRAAINIGDIRAGQEDLRDLQYYNELAKDNGDNISFEEYLETKAKNAERDFQQEGIEFEERYGYNCQDLLEEEMAKQGIAAEKSMTNEEFENVVINIVDRFPEEQQIDMAKDFREYNLTYLELQNCKNELNNEKEKNEEKNNEKNEEKNDELISEKSSLENEKNQSDVSESLKSFVDIVKEKEGISQVISSIKNVENSNFDNVNNSRSMNNSNNGISI